ncbi:MAG: hypothetical protein WAO83_16170 [Fuerstiella sp.]
MPVLKRSAATIQTGTSVRVPEYGATSASSSQKFTASSAPSHQHGSPSVDVVRNNAGDVIQIMVRCACGEVTNINCDY